MEYPPSFYNNRARSIYTQWVEGIKTLRKITIGSSKKDHLDYMNELYETAQGFYNESHDKLNDTTKNQLKVLLSRPADDALYKI